MNINSNQIVSISEANQNFSRVARTAEKLGSVVIFKNNKPKYKLVDIEQSAEIEMTDDEKNAAIAKNAAYGRIVCRCRHLTEEDIIAAVESGAITLDGVKHRCDAMTGRCQGSYCTERIMEIIARKSGVPMQSVVKSGEDSYILESKNES